MSWGTAKAEIAEAVVDTFGDEVIFKPKAGGNVPIKAVVDRSWVEIQVGDGVPISGVRTIVDLNVNDLPAEPVAGDKLSIDGTDYSIVDARSDGGKMLELVLNK